MLSATSVPARNATFIIDTAAPSIPTGLTATAISSSQINLSWTASTDNVAVTGYQVLRGGIVIATVATTSYSDTGLTAGTNYVYTVKAVDAAGNVSAASGSANATTLTSDTTAPIVAITTTPTSTTVSGTSAALQSFETSFQQDLNGDGVIGPASASSSPQFVYQGVDGNGVQLYSVTWSTLGSHPFAVRVLAPDHPSTNYEHSFLFALPVEAGLAQSTYGSGLDELRLLDVQNQYNATIIEPIFPINSWYADNPTDPTIDFETFTATILPAWVDSNFATSGTEENLLIGFSKSGYGGLDLLFKHPSVFDAAAVCDFPGDMAAYNDYGSSSSADYGTDANFQNNYRMTGTFIDTWKAPFTTQDRILISEGPVFATQVADFDALLTSHGVEHTLLTTQTSDPHSWPGGWLSDAVAGLYGLETALPQTVIEGFGSTSLVEDGSNYFLHPNGGSAVELSYAGAPVVAGQFDQFGGPWAPIGAEQTATGYEVAWKVTGADKYTVWNTDNSGNYVSSAFNAASGTSATVKSFETSFQQDLNGDGSIGPPPPPSQTVIEGFGSTSLLAGGSNYFLDPNGGAAVELSYAGAPVVAGQFNQFGGPGRRLARSRRRPAMRWPGRSPAPTSTPCGPPTIAAITFQVLLTSRRERAPRCNRSSPVSSRTSTAMGTLVSC